MKTRMQQLLLTLLIVPSIVHAHSPGAAVSGWQDGFHHPLNGWDHLLAMLAVGVWAAQSQGHAVWRIPVAFVVMMSFGGLIGASGFSVPGSEPMILLSVPVFGVIVIGRIRFRAALSLFIVVFFGFFHGFAHGQEMPPSASVIPFAVGFMTATLLLHGIGILAMRLLVFTSVFLTGSSACAQGSTAASQNTFD